MDKKLENAVSSIYTFWQKNKRMPTFSELGILLKYKSKNAVSKLIDKLLENNLILKDKTGKLIPPDRWEGLPLLGLVEAGFPSPAEEDTLDIISLDDFLIENKNSSFILKVKGDSMIEAGIVNGDFVIADRGREAKVGDIVIADVDGNWTMKYLKKCNKGLYLEAANPDYKDIYPEGELSIGAVVVSVLRKY